MYSRFSLRFPFLLLICGIMALSCTRATPPPVVPGVSLELAEYRKSVLSDISYQLHFTIPEHQDEAIDGSLNLTFRLSQPNHPLQLDFRESENHIRSVSVNGQPSAYQFKDEHIIIPADELKEGENAIDIEFIAGESSLNRNPDYLYTLFVPDRARTAFPAFDQPGLKTTYILTLTIPDEWDALANAPMISDSAGNGTRTLRFAESDPLPTYLFSFVAGRFERITRTINGREMTMLHRETDTEKVARNTDDIFELHASSLSWLEEYTGIEYPYQKFDFALIPGFQYGGMEHTGAILYRASSLFLDEDPSQSALLGRASLIAHESAHMWFGNLVTMEWFNDVWTKEVFANFMAAKIVNPQFEDVNHDLSFLLRHYPSAYGVDRTEGANAIRQHLDNLNHAGQMYGPIIYQKAPVMMRQLELLLGEELFRDGIREYLHRFSHANATWPELIAIFDRLSSQNLTEWSEVWVHTSGRPHFSAETNGETLTVRQTDPTGNGRIWPQQFEITFFKGGNSCSLSITSDRPAVSMEFPDGCTDPDHILLNSNGLGYGLFPVNHNLLSAGLITDEVQRGVMMIYLYENMLDQSGLTPDAYLNLLTEIIPGEENPLLLNLALGHLRSVFWTFLTPDRQFSRIDELEQMLWAGVTSGSRDAAQKRTFFNTYRNIAMSDDALDRLWHLWKKETSVQGFTLSENDYISLAGQLALKMPHRAGEITNEQAGRISNPDRQREFEFIKDALSDNTAVRDAFFESLKDVRNRHTEAWVLQALGYLHHPLRVHESERYLLPSLELLEEIQVTGDIFFPSRWLNEVLGSYSSDTAVATVRNFLAENPGYNDQLRMKILQSADTMFRANQIKQTVN